MSITAHDFFVSGPAVFKLTTTRIRPSMRNATTTARYRPRDARLQGFTLVELVGVLIIVGILAIVAVPRFFNRTTFDSRAWSDQTLSMLRHAQKQAVAQNAPVYVRLDGASIALCHDAACARPVVAPARRNSGSAATMAACGNNAAWFCEAVPSGVSYTASAGGTSYVGPTPRFFFDALGTPFNSGDVPPASSFNHRLTIAVSGDGLTRNLHIERETGYVHAQP
ncbi:pilus assembly FimT family protein [Noviherbaspirillum aridicola]|uniref:MSHA pilin protein MshC n=1 Tax=Noviherbaspirillum aridicola TaxID=2849687 RepID=A0ABQ4Q5F6_9BURK|nr:type II secretion system protein [Noviherbaspirillum aridicola]GIZ52428.1 hypothetical protein NCCP691_24420 [Noviherbaspirillum aridicola]